MYLRMPWCIAPFVISMFCIVGAAQQAGLVRRFAAVVNACTENQHPIAVGLFIGKCAQESPPITHNPIETCSFRVGVIVACELCQQPTSDCSLDEDYSRAMVCG